VSALYPWIVFLHVLGAFAFVLAHGAAALCAFRIRAERDPERIGLLLDLSRLGIGLSYTGLLVLLVAGIAAGIVGQWFGSVWIWAAIGVLVAVMVGMFATATPYYNRVRVAVGKPAYGEGPGPAPVSPAELAALLDSRRPEIIAAIGLAGLALLLWLMVFKPF
jgi:hypothetical protein